MVDTAGTPIPGEGEGQEANPSIEAEIQTKAEAKGWKPQNQWEGNPEDWVPAREFLGRQSLFDKIASLKHDLYATRKQHQAEMASIKKYIADMSEVEFKKAQAELKAQRRQAVQDGDLERADNIEEQLDTLKEKRAETKAATQQPQTPQEPVALTEWRKDNEWFDKDPELRAEAEAIGIGLASKNREQFQRDPRVILDQVTERIKKMYPEKFESKPAPRSTVESGTRRTTSSTTRSGELDWSDLTDDQKRIGNTIIKSGALDAKAKKNKVSPKEQYLADMQLVLRS